jgi:hypothetical protein
MICFVGRMDYYRIARDAGGRETLPGARCASGHAGKRSSAHPRHSPTRRGFGVTVTGTVARYPPAPRAALSVAPLRTRAAEQDSRIDGDGGRSSAASWQPVVDAVPASI